MRTQASPSPPAFRLGVLASHQGTNFQALADACASGDLQAELALLITNNSKAPVVERAQKASVPSLHLSGRTHPSPEALDAALCEALQQAGVSLVVLAGYMKQLGPRLLHEYQGRIINVHPSLLPRHGGKGMYGSRVHQAVLDAGDAQSGATVHLVDGGYDTGRALLQEALAVCPDDTAETLAARIRPLEHRMLVAAVKQMQAALAP